MSAPDLMGCRAVGLCCLVLLSTASTPRAEDRKGYGVHEAARLRREVNLDNWDDGGERSRFVYLNVSQIFPVAVVRRGGPVVPLPLAPNPAVGRYVVEKDGGRDITLDQLLSDGPFDAFVVVHRGRIVYERYPRMRPEDKHLMFSVSKALVGAAVAILEDRGQLRVDRPLGELIAELKGTAWEKVSVRDALEMASGMEGGESSVAAYSDPQNKHYQLEASLGLLAKTAAMPEAVQREETYAYLATLARVRETGSRWEYASVNTAVLGWLLERLTGKTLAEVLGDEIWSRLGAEGDALMVVNRNGIAVAHAGMAATLRDVARFGMLFAPGSAVADGERVISDRVLRRIADPGRPQILEPGHPAWLAHVAYQWDAVTDKGDFFKGGFANQLLYVAPRKGVVIAYFGTNASLDAKPSRLPLRQMIDDLF
jgi:CubicO group peptidase (beta-lactamase class C family)